MEDSGSSFACRTQGDGHGHAQMHQNYNKQNYNKNSFFVELDQGSLEEVTRAIEAYVCSCLCNSWHARESGCFKQRDCMRWNPCCKVGFSEHLSKLGSITMKQSPIQLPTHWCKRWEEDWDKPHTESDNKFADYSSDDNHSIDVDTCKRPFNRGREGYFIVKCIVYSV